MLEDVWRGIGGGKRGEGLVGVCDGGIVEEEETKVGGHGQKKIEAKTTYGAVMASIFLLRIGSDILANEWVWMQEWRSEVVGERGKCFGG